jgi:hypothetical protein
MGEKYAEHGNGTKAIEKEKRGFGWFHAARLVFFWG